MILVGRKLVRHAMQFLTLPIVKFPAASPLGVTASFTLWHGRWLILSIGDHRYIGLLNEAETEITLSEVCAQRNNNWRIEKRESTSDFQRHFAIIDGAEREITKLFFSRLPVNDQLATQFQAERICAAHNSPPL